MFWDLARLEAYHDYLVSLKEAETDGAGSRSFPSTSAGEPSTFQQEMQPPKRPAFLIPFRNRTRGGAAVSAFSRVRDTSPTESSTSSLYSHPSNLSTSHTFANPTQSTHTLNSFHNPSINPPNNLFTAPYEKPMQAKELAKSKEKWAKRYDLGDPWMDLAPHKEEVVKGLEFTGRQVAWSSGGEWCVVVGSAGCLAVFERWGRT